MRAEMVVKRMLKQKKLMLKKLTQKMQKKLILKKK